MKYLFRISLEFLLSKTEAATEDSATELSCSPTTKLHGKSTPNIKMRQQHTVFFFGWAGWMKKIS